MNSQRLFKRNAHGEILEWIISRRDDGTLDILHGVYGGKLIHDVIVPTKKKVDELESRVQEKRKQGYKALGDLYDNAPEYLENANDEYRYLNTYLPKYNTTSEGFVLPMLAKTLEDNKPFDRLGSMLGQWKINGLRCIVGAEATDDLFKPIKFTYHSREGIDWTENMSWYDEILIEQINKDLLESMVDLDICLDGELYLPGYSVNEINSFVKNSKLPQHYLLQYWIYDLCDSDTSALVRAHKIIKGFKCGICDFITSKERHLSNEQQLIVLPSYEIADITKAIQFRDVFIGLGFEGLIVRDTDAGYQFGKRNSAMFKYKRKEDGLFEIVSIKEDKRGLPIYVLKNDINDELFECTINLPQSAQKVQLSIKDQLIGKKGLVEYRERSGVKQVPFHAKLIKIFV